MVYPPTPASNQHWCQVAVLRSRGVFSWTAPKDRPVSSTITPARTQVQVTVTDLFDHASTRPLARRESHKAAD
ncbi:MAG: hypothetical protein WAK86_02940 [Pseudonocardiaceae bacterium]